MDGQDARSKSGTNSYVQFCAGTLGDSGWRANECACGVARLQRFFLLFLPLALTANDLKADELNPEDDLSSIRTGFRI
jgi:hypothetical protein